MCPRPGLRSSIFAVEREPVVRSITREDLIAFANTHLNQEPFARIERVRRP
jgi:hypothetical protein